MAVLAEEDKERIRYHLGYMETSFAGSLQFGIPRPAQTIFLVEQAMTLLNNDYGVERCRKILCKLEAIEDELINAVPALIAEQLGNLKLRGAQYGMTHPDLVEREYVRWAKRLADLLGVPLYPYSDRFKHRGAGNIPVTS